MGVLVRASLACYLGVPLADVDITGVVNGTASVAVAPDDPVNTQAGSCAALSSRAARALRPVASGTISGDEEAAAALQAPNRRELGAAAEYTNVSLVATVGACSIAADGTPELSARLSALIAGLSAMGSPTAPGGPGAAPQLGAFLSAAASASGLPPGAVTAIATVGSPAAVSSPSGGGGSGGASSGSSVPVVAIAAAVAGLILLALAVLVVVLLRRKGPAASGGGGAQKEGEATISGVNPMRSARGAVAFSAEPAQQQQQRRPGQAAEAAAAFGAKQPKRRGSVRSVLSGPRSASSSAGAPPGQQDNPMHGGGGAPAKSPPPPSSGRLYPKAGTAGVSPAQAHAGAVRDGEFSMTSNPMKQQQQPPLSPDTAPPAGGTAAPNSESQIQASAATYASRKPALGGGVTKRSGGRPV